jgi:hypothetical protein
MKLILIKKWSTNLLKNYSRNLILNINQLNPLIQYFKNNIIKPTQLYRI